MLNGETGERWEEEMFWNHFQSVHFLQFLHHGFENQLVVPEKFAKHFKEKLPETVTLKSPSGSTWDVGLTTGNMNTLCFDRGWPSFVEDHSLKENDFLIFKYNGDANFDVLIFEGLSSCEKAASYFVRKCHAKREISSEADLVGSSRKSAAGKRKLEEQSSKLAKKPQYKTTKVENKKYSFAGDEWPPVCLALCAQSRTVGPSPVCRTEIGRVSSRMTFAVDEGKAAASIASSFPCFSRVMRKFNISSSYTVHIPLKFSMAHLPMSKAEIVLRNLEGEVWKVNCNPDSNGRASFCGGWMNFVRGNDIKEGDICTFELVGTNEMCVHISRDGRAVD